MARLDKENPQYIHYENDCFVGEKYDQIYDEARKDMRAFWDDKGR